MTLIIKKGLDADVSNLGIQEWSDLSIDDQVNAIVRSCNYNIRQLCAVRSTLSRDAMRDAAYALVLSRLDYCNYLYSNAPVIQMQHLQMIINMAVRVVSGRRRFDPITDFIKCELHWLPVIKCVQFKICTFSRLFTISHTVTFQSLLFRRRPSLDDVIYILHLNKFS